jgi:hypothetical protein
MSDVAAGGEAPGNVSGDDVATYTAPLFSVKRFAGMKEYVVPEDMYSKMRYGRESGSRWVDESHFTLTEKKTGGSNPAGLFS